MTRSIRLVAALLAAGSAALAPAIAQAAPRAHASARAQAGKTSAPSTTPSSVTALPGSASATVRWQAPATVDGAPVTSYTVTASSGQTMTADEPNHWAIVPV